VHTWLLFLHLHLDLGLQARFGLLHEHLISDINSSGAKGTPSSTTIGSIEVCLPLASGHGLLEIKLEDLEL
jgi:hypothetical protein